MTCYDCNGDGYQMFLGKESTCVTCGGEGTVIVCDTFAYAPDAVVAFRNQKCHNCGVRENDHNVQAVR